MGYMISTVEAITGNPWRRGARKFAVNSFTFRATGYHPDSFGQPWTFRLTVAPVLLKSITVNLFGD